MPDPTEHQIIMQAQSVRAILAGRKTQTRRVLKPQPPKWVGEFGRTTFTPPGHLSGRGTFAGGVSEKFFRCPYGLAGHRLWVRETHCYERASGTDLGPDPGWSVVVRYMADNVMEARTVSREEWSGVRVGVRTRPSIHMPRWACRLELDVTDVRVERVQDISAEDVLAEGMTATTLKGHPLEIEKDGVVTRTEFAFTSPSYAFALLWDSINAKRGFGWKSNPWVYVVSFEVRP